MDKLLKIATLMLLLVMGNALELNAQTEKEITLIVSADGSTKEEAIKIALRSAIEQAYGTFVSANTEILNDEIVKDEIVTISSGNIKEYHEVSSAILPNGSFMQTLQVIVNIGNLVSYAKSKGAECEFAGAAFVSNLKQKQLNEENEVKVLCNMFVHAYKLLSVGWDYTLDVKSTKANGVIECGVQLIPNKNGIAAISILKSTLQSLSLTGSEIEEYRELELPVYPIGLFSFNQITKTTQVGDVTTRMMPTGKNTNASKEMNVYGVNRDKTIYLRNKSSYSLLWEFCNYGYVKNALNFCIKGNDVESKVLINYAAIVQPQFNFQLQKYTADKEIISPLTKFISEDAKNGNIAIVYCSALKSIRKEDFKSSYYLSPDRYRNEEMCYMANPTAMNYIVQIINADKLFLYPSEIEELSTMDSSFKRKVNILNGVILPDTTPKDIEVIMSIPLDELAKITEFTIKSNAEK